MARSLWQTFKFQAGIKQPIVLRPLQTTWPTRLVLAALKCVEKLPKTLFRAHLSFDCNERIVEYPFVLQAIGDVRGKRILEFGCAESVLSISLACLGAKVVGVDLREYPFRHPNFSFHKGDFLSSGFSDASFDIVVAVSAVEHCGLNAYGSAQYADGDLRAVREFNRLLRGGGMLLLTVPFGTRYLDHELRIYDPQTIAELLKGFSISASRFYCKSPSCEYWLECSEEKASTAVYDPVTGVQGVGLFACLKTW